MLKIFFAVYFLAELKEGKEQQDSSEDEAFKEEVSNDAEENISGIEF